MTIAKGIARAACCAVAAALLLSGCGGKGDKPPEFSDTLNASELYDAALSEGTLVVYSVSGRAFRAKDAFERQYPGLSVEVKDIRSNDVVELLRQNHEAGRFGCDVVICSDCDGSLYKELIEPGIIVPYVPWDIAPAMKENSAEFVGEAIMLFYNTNVFDEVPITNIWQLTEDSYRGRIMMPSPLSSFSTYGFCAQTLAESEKLAAAYEQYAGSALDVPEGMTAGEVFWQALGENIVYVNSNDEVLEGVGNSEDMWFGVMISSKLRYKDLGYHIAPITRLEPFSSVYTPNCIALTSSAENINAAKLFIRFIYGETDGKSEGAAAFRTEGSWSVRTDTPDGSSIPLEALDILYPDKNFLYDNNAHITEFFGRLLEENIKARGGITVDS